MVFEGTMEIVICFLYHFTHDRFFLKGQFLHFFEKCLKLKILSYTKKKKNPGPILGRKREKFEENQGKMMEIWGKNEESGTLAHSGL